MYIRAIQGQIGPLQLVEKKKKADGPVKKAAIQDQDIHTYIHTFIHARMQQVTYTHAYMHTCTCRANTKRKVKYFHQEFVRGYGPGGGGWKTVQHGFTGLQVNIEGRRLGSEPNRTREGEPSFSSRVRPPFTPVTPNRSAITLLRMFYTCMSDKRATHGRNQPA